MLYLLLGSFQAISNLFLIPSRRGMYFIGKISHLEIFTLFHILWGLDKRKHGPHFRPSVSLSVTWSVHRSVGVRVSDERRYRLHTWVLCYFMQRVISIQRRSKMGLKCVRLLKNAFYLNFVYIKVGRIK